MNSLCQKPPNSVDASVDATRLSQAMSNIAGLQVFITPTFEISVLCGIRDGVKLNTHYLLDFESVNITSALIYVLSSCLQLSSLPAPGAVYKSFILSICIAATVGSHRAIHGTTMACRRPGLGLTATMIGMATDGTCRIDGMPPAMVQ